MAADSKQPLLYGFFVLATFNILHCSDSTPTSHNYVQGAPELLWFVLGNTNLSVDTPSVSGPSHAYLRTVCERFVLHELIVNSYNL